MGANLAAADPSSHDGFEITKPSMPQKTEFLGTRDVSKVCDRSEATIRWWVRTGKLRAFTLPSGQHIFRRADVERLHEAQSVPKTEKGQS